MKRLQFPLTASLLSLLIWSCSNNNTNSGTTSDSTTSTTGTTDTSTTSTTATTPTTSTAATGMPLGKEDSTFVLKAAMGGMEEVEMGKLAQQNGMSQRVKDFGAMMVRDHSQANNELKSLASGRGINLPDSLSSDKKKMVENMRKMTGKSFDQHYISMMLSDHKKDVDEFKKQSENAKDADLKNWATKTLPVLQTHLDSIQAISKSKM